jgi:hypothetical protein
MTGMRALRWSLVTVDLHFLCGDALFGFVRFLYIAAKRSSSLLSRLAKSADGPHHALSVLPTILPPSKHPVDPALAIYVLYAFT